MPKRKEIAVPKRIDLPHIQRNASVPNEIVGPTIMDLPRAQRDATVGTTKIEPSLPSGNAYKFKVFSDVPGGGWGYYHPRIKGGCPVSMDAGGGVAFSESEDGVDQTFAFWEIWKAFALEAGYSRDLLDQVEPTRDNYRKPSRFPTPGGRPADVEALLKEVRLSWEWAKGDHGEPGAYSIAGMLRVPIRGSDGKIRFDRFEFGVQLFLELTYQLSTTPTRYGLGKTIRALTLLPGEEQEITLKTWQTTASTKTSTTTLVDSLQEETKSNFQSELERETQSSSSTEDSFKWNVQAAASASFFSMATASVSGGAAGETKSAVNDAVRAVSKSLNEHAASANRNRQMEVNTKDELSQTSGVEETVLRRIRNVNLRRALHFVFRELNQVYETRIHLLGIRVGVRSNVPNDYCLVDIRDARDLFEGLRQALPADVIMHNLVREVGTMFDAKEDLIPVLEEYGPPDWKPIPRDSAFFHSLTVADSKTPAAKLISSEARRWRFRRNINPLAKSLAERDAIGQEGESVKVAGLVVARDEAVLKTTSIVTEALLGSEDALDNFAFRMQEAAATERELQNKKIQAGLDAVAAAKDQSTAYREVFGQPVVVAPWPRNDDKPPSP
ncbi:hypothetical protein [Corallococcus carmarthensis]|uniref:hypothetical protein n=1 Tax=Corallococcus carmarthensis TaxID=2316728 RepID=UPI0011C37F0E|nr:hypothetical protein [Corallococcus carmarthensis]